ncbi:unnamed protein product [Dibothriocephalus latus]|uniref:Uncharacterized protein n=1 Tax=Dibothriocephalus latus TaxID=60516 RepID=A0A3P7LB84_DIBLA|nr:unnamed protein product [Dibothriocephalus latus]
MYGPRFIRVGGKNELRAAGGEELYTSLHVHFYCGLTNAVFREKHPVVVGMYHVDEILMKTKFLRDLPQPFANHLVECFFQVMKPSRDDNNVSCVAKMTKNTLAHWQESLFQLAVTVV